MTAKVNAADMSGPQSAASERQEWQMLALINTVRAQRNVPELRMEATGLNYARIHAAEMAAAKRIWHDMAAYGTHIPAGASVWGENVAVASSMNEAHKALLQSPGHLKNIVDAKYSHVGIGVWQAGGRTYVSQNFLTAPGLVAQKPPAPPAPATTAAPAEVPVPSSTTVESTTSTTVPPPAPAEGGLETGVVGSPPLLGDEALVTTPGTTTPVPVLRNIGRLDDPLTAARWASRLEKPFSVPVLRKVS